MNIKKINKFDINYYINIIKRIKYYGELSAGYKGDDISIKELIDKINNKNIDSIYLDIYIPFCESLCTYCQYHTLTLNNSDKYLDNIILLLNYLGKKINTKIISNLEIDGGTPTLLTAVQLDKLLGTIHDNYIFNSNSFKFINATPSTIDIDKIRILEKYNFSSIELGFQTINDDNLKLLNRYNNGKNEMELAIKMIRKSKIPYIITHLLVGLYNDNSLIFKESIEFLCKLGVDEIPIFLLNPVPKYVKKFFNGDVYFFNNYVLKISQEYFKIAKTVSKEFGYTIDNDINHLTQRWALRKLNSNYYIKSGNNKLRNDYKIGIGLSKEGGSYDIVEYKGVSDFKKWISDINIDSKLFNFKDNIRYIIVSYIEFKFKMNNICYIDDIYIKYGVNILEFLKQELKIIQDLNLIIIEDNTISPLIKRDNKKYYLLFMIFYGKDIVKNIFDKDGVIFKELFNKYKNG